MIDGEVPLNVGDVELTGVEDELIAGELEPNVTDVKLTCVEVVLTNGEVALSVFFF